MPRLGELWEKQWLPEMQPKLARSRNTDYSGLSDADLMARFDEMKAEVDERWFVHGMLLYSFYAAGVFADYFNEVMQPEDSKEGYEALQGFETQATESSRGLWALSRTVRNDTRAQAPLRRDAGTRPARRAGEERRRTFFPGGPARLPRRVRLARRQRHTS